MTTAPEYVFPRDFLDNNRINLQHYLWREIYGYSVHPSIPLTNPQLRIADIGTGTAAWLFDLAQTLPKSVKLDGFDVSFEASPPIACAPPNVSYHIWSVKDSVPEQFRGIYDIVHVRLFLFVLKADEVPRVVENIVQLLKPGGYLQWGEVDDASFRIEKITPECETDGLMTIFGGDKWDERLKPKWIPQLEAMFIKNGGLEAVEVDVKEAAPHHCWMMQQCSLVIPWLLARHAKDEERCRQIDELLPKVTQEAKAGAWWAFTRYVVVGRKPTRQVAAKG